MPCCLREASAPFANDLGVLFIAPNYFVNVNCEGLSEHAALNAGDDPLDYTVKMMNFKELRKTCRVAQVSFLSFTSEIFHINKLRIA